MDYPDVTRRNWLKQAAAAAGTTALAGCGDGGDQQFDYSVPDEDVDKTFATSEFTSLTTLNFNPYDTLNHPNQSIYYVFNQLMDEIKVRGEGGGLDLKHFPNLAEDWNRDGDVFTVFIDDRYTWHNGDPVTADDVAVNLTLDLLAETREWDQALEDVRVEDEYTVVIELQEDAHDKLVMDFIEGPPGLATHPGVYSEFLPEDGSRGKGAYADLPSFERSTLRGNLLSMTVRAPPGEGTKGNKPVIGNGPWKLAEMGEQEMVFERHEGHPFADRINFTRVKFIEYVSNQARYQALLSDRFSGLDLTLTQSVWDQLEDYYQRYRYVRKLGHGVAVNYETFPDHRVRQAIAYAINKPQVVGNSGLAEPLQKPHEEDSAVYAEPGVQRTQFGEGFLDKLTRYDHNEERAAELLREVGWSRDDGQWYDENDERVEATLKVPITWTEFVNMARTEVEHLSSFGIDASMQTEELVVYYGQTMIQADYDLAHWWVGGARGFPWYSYNTIWNALQTIADNHNHPDVYQNVPGPIGEHNGDETFSVNVQSRLSELSTTRTTDPVIRDIRQELAWTYNQMMPVYCIHEAQGVASLDGRNWQAPDPDEEVGPNNDVPGNHFFPIHYIQNRCHMKATDF